MTKTLNDYANAMDHSAAIAGLARNLNSDDKYADAIRHLCTRMFISGALTVLESASSNVSGLGKVAAEIRAIHEHTSKDLDNL